MSNLDLSSLTSVHWLIEYAESMLCGVGVCMCVGGCVHNVCGWVDGVYVDRNVAARRP